MFPYPLNPIRCSRVILCAWSVLAVAGLGTVSAQDDPLHIVRFEGGSGSLLFSDAANWTAMPGPGSVVGNIDGTHADARAVVDKAFPNLSGRARIGAVHVKTRGQGTAYVEIEEGAVLEAMSVLVGQDGTGRCGDLVVRKGGRLLAGNTANSGLLSIGGADRGDGVLTVEAGAEVEAARLELGETGVLRLIAGADGIPGIRTTKSTPGHANLIDGRIEIDLSALGQPGEFVLVDGQGGDHLLGGALMNALKAAGGSLTAEAAAGKVVVTGAGDREWSLQTADDGRDLVLSVK